jgi:thioredoxin-related protein
MNGMTSSSLRRGFASVLILAIGGGAALAQQPAKNPAKLASAAKRASIYDKAADAKAAVEKAAERAKRENKRILLMFGGDWCGWCHKLHDLFARDREISKILSNEYELVMVDLEAPNAPALLDACKAALSQDELRRGVGYPFLAVLDADGKVITAQRTDPLEEGDHHDPKRVQAFLTRWTVPPKDAKLVVAEALSRAASADKRVFLTFGAPWCSWCHRLEEWLAQPENTAILDRDFVIAKVDIERMSGGKELMDRYRPKTSSGIPWYAILDAKGKLLSSADGPDGDNIAYPLRPKEINSFLAMIKGQSRRIEDRQVDQLRKSLDETGDRIWQQMGLSSVKRQ